MRAKPQRGDIIVAIYLNCGGRAPRGVTLFWLIETVEVAIPELWTPMSLN